MKFNIRLILIFYVNFHTTLLPFPLQIFLHQHSFLLPFSEPRFVIFPARLARWSSLSPVCLFQVNGGGHRSVHLHRVRGRRREGNRQK